VRSGNDWDCLPPTLSFHLNQLRNYRGDVLDQGRGYFAGVGLIVDSAAERAAYSSCSRNTFRIKSVSLYSRPSAIHSPSKRR
jgi:hypothetical protein